MEQKRLLARNATLLNQNEINFDPDSFIQRLLLFDNYILDSIRLKEVPHIVNLIGCTGFIELLKSGFFQIRLEAKTVAQTQQNHIQAFGRKIPNFNNYTFHMISSVEKEYRHSCLQNINTINSVDKREKQKLKLQIIDNLIKAPENFGVAALNQSKLDFINSPELFNTILLRELEKHYKIITESNKIIVNIEEKSNNNFFIESNLKKDFNLTEIEIHKIVESSLLATCGMNLKFEEMEVFDSISGFKNEEANLLDTRTRSILKKIDGYKPEENFTRVLDIQRFPELKINKDIKIDIDKLLKIRESKDCIEFREWLSTIDKYNDKDINDQFNNYKSKLQNLATTTEGKAFRFIIGSVLGFTASPWAGLAYAGIDTYILNKVIPRKGYISFIHNDFPSIYKN